jgi:thiosulfate reductase cytochrome b subunit
MIWSGALIYWANDVYRTGFGGFTVFQFFPDAFYREAGIDHRLAEGIAWHFVFLWLFAVNGICYVAYKVISAE